MAGTQALEPSPSGTHSQKAQLEVEQRLEPRTLIWDVGMARTSYQSH